MPGPSRPHAGAADARRRGPLPVALVPAPVNEPSSLLAFHPARRVLGFDWRRLNVALVHQSKGRSQGLSRSWNRVYAQVGAAVRGHVQVFSGCGESLVDCNWKQTTVGVGISLADGF